MAYIALSLKARVLHSWKLRNRVLMPCVGQYELDNALLALFCGGGHVYQPTGKT